MYRATDLQVRESILAILLILLICYWLTELKGFFYALVPVILLGMLAPGAFRLFANLWFSLGHLLGKVVSKLIIGLVFALVVIPMGLVRKCFGYDPLGAKKWHASRNSAFIQREHTFNADDLTNPY